MYNKPKPIKEYLTDFKPKNMGTGLKRGMVLRIYKAKIKQIGCEGCLSEITGQQLKGKDDNPSLFIYLKSGSIWRSELHQQRYQLKMLINERLESDFIKEIVIR